MPRVALLAAVILSCAGGTSAPATAVVSTLQEPPIAQMRVPSLVVRGEAILEKKPDQVTIRLSVVTEAERADLAVDRNSQRMSEVLKEIRRIGLADDEIATGGFRVQPKYSRPPVVRGGEQRQTRRIIGYQITNQLIIKTMKIDLTAKILQVAVEAGVNDVAGISFGLADRRAYRREVVETATRNAIADAQAMAEAAGLRLLRVLSMTLDDARPAPPIPSMMGRMNVASFGAEAITAPPIMPGDVTLRASVTIEYEIDAR